MAGRARVSGVAYRILRLVLLPHSESTRRVYRGSHATDRHSREWGETSADVRTQHGAPKGTLLVSMMRSTWCTKRLSVSVDDAHSTWCTKKPSVSVDDVFNMVHQKALC